ncbi:hypothetical protein SeMB42_g07479, partial [Synchytrium endobioticum]
MFKGLTKQPHSGHHLIVGQEPGQINVGYSGMAFSRSLEPEKLHTPPSSSHDIQLHPRLTCA